MYQRILLPTDGGEGVDSAIEHALELAGDYEAELHVLHVVDDGALDSVSEDAMADIRQRGDEAVSDVAERAADVGIETETVVREGSPHREILDYADAAGVDMIVMGTHGRSGVGRVLMGSVTERVVRSASVPVVTVRVGAGEGGEVRTPAAAERRARRALEKAGNEEIRFPEEPYRTSTAWVVPARTAGGTFNVHVDPGEGSTRLARLDD